MNIDIMRIIEFAILVAGVLGLSLAVFKSKTIQATLENQAKLIEAQRERLDLLSVENKELSHKHIENEKAIAELQGQIKVYKELPLREIASSLKILETIPGEFAKVSEANTKKILETIQHVDVQEVGKQVVNR